MGEDCNKRSYRPSSAVQGERPGPDPEKMLSQFKLKHLSIIFEMWTIMVKLSLLLTVTQKSAHIRMILNGNQMVVCGLVSNLIQGI